MAYKLPCIKFEGRVVRLRRPKHEHRDCRGRFAKQTTPTETEYDFWAHQLYASLHIPLSVMLPKGPICPNTAQ